MRLIETCWVGSMFIGCGVCIVRGENEECACLCTTRCALPTTTSNKKVQCKTQAMKKTPRIHNTQNDKKVKLFSSVRPPQQESDSPTERYTHTIFEEPLGSAVLYVS